MTDDDERPEPSLRALVYDLAGSLESIAAELYRIRVALEVVAGDALDRQLDGPVADHPAGGELRYLGRLGVTIDDLESRRPHPLGEPLEPDER